MLLLRLLLLGALGAPAVRAEPAAPVPFPDPAAPAAAPLVARDRVLLRLTPDEAALARRAPADASARLTRTGSFALDAAAARLPGVWYEREFPGEAPPPPGSALPDLTAFWIAHLPPGDARVTALATFSGTPGIERAEPIHVVPVTVVPSDSLWSRSWYFYQASRRDLHAPEAWSLTTGDTSVVIAIVDTGIIPYHPDLGGTTAGLSGQIWTNWREAAGTPGVDDDGNGFVDDVHGWDFVNLETNDDVVSGEDWRDQDNDPNDFAGHGTAVAGVAGALSDNRIGVTGTAWQTRIMPLRAGWSSPLAPFGEVDLSFAARSILYAARNGAAVINCSFASVLQGDLDAAVTTAIDAGVCVVSAAGNNGSVHGLSDRDDVISVAATDQDDKLSLFSNRGSYVDLCAPGANIATTILARTGPDSIGQRQSSYSLGGAGTSFSAPLVAGAVALLQAARRSAGKPPLSPMEMQTRLRETADDIADQNPGLSGFGDGRLNLLRALTDPTTSILLPARGATPGAAAVVHGTSGRDRVVLAMLPGQLLMLDGATGDTVFVRALSGAPLGGVAAADLGGGRGAGLFVATANGWVDGFDASGNPLPGWPVLATGSYESLPLEPVLGDLDGDGKPEVLWGGADGFVWAWHTDGHLVAGFPRAVGVAGGNVRLALSDFDGAPGVEIVAAAPNGAVHLLSGDGGERPGWPISTQAGPRTPAILYAPSLSGPEIILAAGNQVEARQPDGTRRWSFTPFTQIGEAPVAGDLDGDGVDEIVVPRVLFTKLIVLGPDGDLRASTWEVGAQLFGSPIIGPLRPGQNGVLVTAGSLEGVKVVALDATGAPVIGWPKPGRCGAELNLADLDADGRTEVVAGAGADSTVYIYDSGRGSWNPAAGSWPTSHANDARTGSRLYAPAPATFDDVPPVAVNDLSAGVVAAESVTLRWTAPADPGSTPGAVEYDLRRAFTPLDDSDFDLGVRIPGVSAPGPPGARDTALVSGLEEDRTYWFALRSRDASGNWSHVSAPLEITTAGDRPAVVRDLRVRSAADSSLTLVWTATGDDGTRGRPHQYRIRGGPWSSAPPSFDDAPIRLEQLATVDAGGTESAKVGGLDRARRYWFAVQAVDDAGNLSDVSNPISSLVGPLGAKLGVALAAGRQPALAPVDIFWQGAAGAASQPQFIRIYDVTGRLRRTLRLPATSDGLVVWDGYDEFGRAEPAGLYFALLSSGGFRATARIALLR